MVDLADIVDRIKDKPFLLYYLYNKFLTGDDTRLPGFISRRKVVIELIDLGIIEFITGDKKHLHSKETKFTHLGIEVYYKLEKLGVFTIFPNISLYSRNSFITQYEAKLTNLEEKVRYPQSVFYKLILENIGDFNKWNRNGNVEYRVLGIELINITEEHENLRVLFEFKCRFCSKNIEQSMN